MTDADFDQLIESLAAASVSANASDDAVAAALPSALRRDAPWLAEEFHPHVALAVMHRRALLCRDRRLRGVQEAHDKALAEAIKS
jgi:hypothetical protein